MTTNQSDNLVRENLKRIRFQAEEALARCGRSWEELRIMAVTKTVEPQVVNLAIQDGIDLLGENRVQEFLTKEEFYDLSQAEVHFIGHLQSNKVKYIIKKVSMIESVSSYKLAQEISRCAQKEQLHMNVLLEVNIGGEESKNGFSVEELWQALPQIAEMPGICVQGLMAIPPKECTEKFFCAMKQLFVDIKAKKLDNVNMSVLSMGMSADFPLAIQYGSNLIRVGTALFGGRPTQK